MTTVLILAANEVHDIRDRGYPLCLTEIEGKPLVQHLSQRCNTIPNVKVIFTVRNEDCKRWHLDNMFKQLTTHCKVLHVDRETGGAACTALLAVADINNEEPLLIISGNELLDVDFYAVISQFAEKNYDAGVIIFPSVHPRYSYVRLDHENRVVETAEKNPISNHATASFYWFKQGRAFVEAAQKMILKGAHVDGKYYICPVMNELILKQKIIGIQPIEASRYHPLKSERQIDRFDAIINNK
jgi:dTDP-glucose pyrophosphorylase